MIYYKVFAFQIDADDLQGRHLQNEHLYHRVLDVRKATDAGWG